MGWFLDLFTGHSGFTTSDTTGMTDDGHLFIQTGDNTAMDMTTGETHFTAGWPQNNDHIIPGWPGNDGNGGMFGQ